jgi:hypothetical protein
VACRGQKLIYAAARPPYLYRPLLVDAEEKLNARFCRIYSSRRIRLKNHTARQYTENSKQTFPEMKLRSLSPNSYIHVLWAIYLFPRLVCLFCCRKIGGPRWEYINRSQTHECENWDWGRKVFFFWEHINRIFFAVQPRKCFLHSEFYPLTPSHQCSTAFTLGNWPDDMVLEKNKAGAQLARYSNIFCSRKATILFRRNIRVSFLDTGTLESSRWKTGNPAWSVRKWTVTIG